MLKCYSSCRRVRSPDPWASVGYEAFQDAIVQAGSDAPVPPARASQLEASPLAHLGHGRLFEGAQAAGRQRPHVDLVLGLPHGDERGVGPECAPPLARFALCFSAHLLSPSPPSCANLVPTPLLYALRAARRHLPRVARAAAPSTSRRIPGTQTSRRGDGRCACSRRGGPPRRRPP